MKRPPAILLTGFEPFGGDDFNPSGEIARHLHGATIRGHVVQSALLPCVFGAVRRELRAALARTRPALVVCLGLAGGRGEITPERVAINVDDARIPDNAGRQPVDRPVVAGGPAAYWSTLPVKAIVGALQHRGLPASVSHTAGTFVCNHVFYVLMHELRRRKAVRGGFIHVPHAREHAPGGLPALALGVLTDAVALALETCVRAKRDLRRAAGQTH
ncbi:MAG TPA: pyroglutamyl-peptidase I [Opitutaceae bacterium]|nr:pyroglutamyl-peptidase I [Opitutaceae bacterium]